MRPMLLATMLMLAGAPEILGAWIGGPPLPQQRSGLGAVLGQDGRIYAVGGHEVNGGARPRDSVYALLGNVWSAVTSLNEARTSHAVVICPDGGIWAIGGLGGPTGDTLLSSCERYHPSLNAWTNQFGPGLPGLVLHAAVCRQDGVIWVLGGYRSLDFKTPSKEVFVRDPVTGLWDSTRNPPVLEARGALGAAIDWRGRVYAIGRNGDGGLSEGAIPTQVHGSTSSL